MNSRLAIALAVTVFIIGGTLLLIQFAKGYRPDIETGEIKPTGLLVATSEPEGAQVFVNGELKTATDDTINLDPGNYRVQIKKDGYIPWVKQLQIEKELVTQTNARLFPAVPNLQALTNAGALNPELSPSGTRIIYVIPEASPAAETTTVSNLPPKSGLWFLELSNLPLGFSREPQQLVAGPPPIADKAWTDAQLQWSPDSREVLALFYTQKPDPTATESAQPTHAYIINPGQDTTPANELVNSANQYTELTQDWDLEKSKMLDNQLEKLPEEFAALIATSASELQFSPDETKLLYVATSSAQLLEQYDTPLLAASNQPQARTLIPNNTYLYDIKEDRNFLILNQEQTLQIANCPTEQPTEPPLQDTSCPTIDWFPTSAHLLYFTGEKVVILEYDATNQHTVYAGPIEQNYVFAHPSPSQILIITTLNPDASPLPNLYTLSLQ